MCATVSDTLALATEIAVINMYDATEWVMLLCLQKGMHDLLFDQTRTMIADVQCLDKVSAEMLFLFW